MKASEEHLCYYFFCEVVSVEIRPWFIIMHNARHNISKERYITPRLDSYSWLLQRCQWNSSTLQNLWTHNNYCMVNTDVSQKCGAVCREQQHNCGCMQTTCSRLSTFVWMHQCKYLCLKHCGCWHCAHISHLLTEEADLYFPGTFLPCCGVRAAIFRRRCTVNSDEWARLTPVEWGNTCPCRMEPLPPLTFLSQ